MILPDIILRAPDSRDTAETMLSLAHLFLDEHPDRKVGSRHCVVYMLGDNRTFLVYFSSRERVVVRPNVPTVARTAPMETS